jgi:hypothetical protein
MVALLLQITIVGARIASQHRVSIAAGGGGSSRIGHFSQGVGFKVTYTEISAGIQTTHHPPDYFITGLEPS